MRTFFTALGIVLYLIYSLILILISKFLRGETKQKFITKQVTMFAKTAFKLTGSKIEVKGLENIPDGPVLFVSNHQSNFDIPIFLGYLNKPLGFIAKKEMEKIPILSTWMRYIHCVFMDRSNVRNAVKSINDGIKILKNGHSLMVFPEGTRSHDGKIGEFKPGSFKLATNSGVPIVPVTISGSIDIMPKNKVEVRKANVKVVVGKPIEVSSEDKKKTPELAEKVREIIKENL
ncbi:1-acyl-sn-glycerol-3-phosphate acyltransferase [Tepiditoga spiralis]|uniref:1-acyl-sn-glycerol-3-phosphate acyltransferase n=1 Tax=Tepiditoga spiralis TaxID=2108365 RepID=A0A7G1G1J4_9BACT|nr:lysophospholipid acyltransferase family protein [Tepiditoga spiralis]BBE30060.1 1-acyl-sn-glycerol-3-phosphate acyltransferase [Tepiditoga spiralis]